MRKNIIFMVLLLILSACSSEKNVFDDLQSIKWNVVSTTGEAYTAEFNVDTVSFQKGPFTLGMSYEIDGNKITLQRKDDVYNFEFEKLGDEYKFSSLDDVTKENSGDLTLSPLK